MPALSPTMTEGKILRWLKKEGEQVSSGQPVAEVETDKANLEMEAYEEGTLLRILVKEGESAPVGATIAYIGEKGEKVEAPPPRAPEAAPKPAAPPAPPAMKKPGEVVPIRQVGRKLHASPLARKMAAERGMDLEALAGSGPSGRIIKRDIERAAAAVPARLPPLPALLERRAPEAVPLSSIRRIIAQRMTESKPGVPHFYLTVEVEMDAALKAREEAQALEAKVSINDIVVKAAAMALRRHPKLNVQYRAEQALRLGNVDVGIAVAIEDGLITPIIRDADAKGLGAIATESRALIERARRRALRPEEYQGGSITVSNLGMFGIDSFAAIINPPQAAILAVGQVAPKPVVRDGQVVVRQMMSATLSGDHRVIDGALGAEYLREVRALLEHPLRLLV
ncbi:MAG: 2-oxo acid dehydrogenase subunit E2 [Myxococcales bacterium]|nr:2-oxo acid dehydrogenase subunit E2 [Myxococcales bacterium]